MSTAPVLLLDVMGTLVYDPFYEEIPRFFGMSFQEADEFNAVNGHQFIADLMPKTPIYIDMLTDSARAVIGQCLLEFTQPALVRASQKTLLAEDTFIVDRFESNAAQPFETGLQALAFNRSGRRDDTHPITGP